MDSKTKSEDFDVQEVSEEEPPSDATYGGSIDIWEPLEMVRRAFDIQICKGSVPPQVRTSTFEVLTQPLTGAEILALLMKQTVDYYSRSTKKQGKEHVQAPVLGLAQLVLSQCELDWRYEMTEKQKERVQFDFSLEALQRLDDIKQKTGAATRAETVRNALRLYEWLVSEVDPNSTITVVDKDNEVTSIFKAKLLLQQRFLSPTADTSIEYPRACG